MSKHSLVINAVSCIYNIRNNYNISVVSVDCNSLLTDVLDVLLQKSYILGYNVIDNKPKKVAQIFLKFDKFGKNVINNIKFYSTNSKQVYMGSEEIKLLLSPFSVVAVSTSKGICSGDDCVKKNIGGKVLFGLSI